jgi:two-component system, sensor histidine kinase and response regulator
MSGESPFGRQFQVVFEQSPIGIVVMDGVGRIQYVNNAVRNFLGYGERELIGGFLTSFSHQEDSEFFQTLFAEIVEGDRNDFQVVSRCKQKAGNIAWWRVDMRAVRPADSSPFMIAVVDDITSQKNDEERLRRAKELAESATRTKSAFLANMSHEIRTPLHTINGMAELMRDTGLDEEQLEYLNQIQFASEVLLGLINDILDFSKIEAGRLQLEQIRFEPVKMIEDAVDMVSMQAHRKGLEVILITDEDLPETVVGDPARIRQVVVNLVNNAVKFTENGYIRVSAELRKRGDGFQMLIQVKDTGIGIPPERQNRLFKPFSQVDASMTRRYGGTGLGLSISRDLVGMMGGKIGVKSKPGLGSNFWFSLPLVDPGEETTTMEPPRGLPEHARCLVVDDNRESRMAMETYLGRWGVTVETAGDASSALKILEKTAGSTSSPDIVFLDLRLPSMDGWQLASEIRNDDRFDAVPLVLMSPTGVSSGDAKMKLLRWFKAYINKPVKPRELKQAFEAVFADDIEELEAVDAESVGEGQGPAKERSLRGQVVLPETVLVAEDHFVNQQLFQTILDKRGFRTLVASDGLEAVQAVQTNPEIGLIFMDVQMPNLNGYDATMKIRELGVQTPIVAVTANALSGDRDRCVRVGMNEYMAKPFKKGDIDAVLKRLEDAGFFRGNDPVTSSKALDDEEFVDELVPLDDEVVELNAFEEPGGDSDTNDDPPMDIAETIESFMGDVETAERVSRAFAERLPEQIAQVEALIREGKVADARVIIHAVKGGAWNLNSQDLGEAAKAVEDHCAAEEAREALNHLPAVVREAERFRHFILSVSFPRE